MRALGRKASGRRDLVRKERRVRSDFSFLPTALLPLALLTRAFLPKAVMSLVSGIP
jgi:hypothetical protein